MSDEPGEPSDGANEPSDGANEPSDGTNEGADDGTEGTDEPGDRASGDWFEQALRELATEEDVTVPDDVDVDVGSSTDGEEAPEPDVSPSGDGEAGPDRGGGPGAGETGPERGRGPGSGDSSRGGSQDSPRGGSRDGSRDGAGGEPAFGVGDAEEFSSREPGDFGLGGGEAGGPGGGGSGDEFGFAEFGGEEFGFGTAGTDFEDVEFESDIDRVDIGIEGLDEMILGGVPERSLMVTIGAAGTGKTTFALQFLHEALRTDGKAIYITLEESREAILSTAEEKGWPFTEYESEGRLAVVGLDPIEMANSLNSIRGDLSRLVNDFEADRLVLDSVSLLEMMYDHPAKRRSEVFDFARSLKNAGVTTMLTSEASEDSPYASRYGIVEYLVDAVFVLQYVRPSDFRETRLAVEIQKIRDANHSRETKPYEITGEGISVYRQANIF